MLTILGPTASGKTALAAAVAARTGAEVISADSRQVYRRMDIGTGKDLVDYVVDGRAVSYHLIDICEPGTRYNLFRYQQDFRRALDDITARGRQAILCGGTGLYIEAVLRDYRLAPVAENRALRASLEGKSMDELTTMLRHLKERRGTALHNTTDIDTAQRAIRAIEIELGSTDDDSAPASGAPTAPAPRHATPAPQPLIVGLDMPRDVRRQRITQRLRRRLAGGMIDEVRRLLSDGITADDLMYYGLEYKYVTEHVVGLTTYDEMAGRLETAIHQFAKRQMTWFRGMERRGLTIHWIDALQPMEHKVDEVTALMTDEG